MSITTILVGLCAGGLLAVWIIYPLIIALLALRRSRRSGQRPAGSQPVPRSVSMIIASRDDAATTRARLLDCLRSAPSVGSYEVIVALDASVADENTEVLTVAENTTVIRGDSPGGKAATLNAAVRAARGELLVFTDVHQRFEPHAVSLLLAAFADERVGAASGRLELDETARRSLVGLYWSYERWLRRYEAAVHSCVGVTGAFWALRRSLWQPLPPDLILDDVYTPMRVVLSGRRVAFVDEARVVDLRRADPANEYRRKVRTLTGVIQLCCWLPQLVVPGRHPIWPQFVVHKVFRFLTPYWLIGLCTWGGILALRLLASIPPLTVMAFLALASVSALKTARVIRVARKTALWGVRLQAATVVAMVNGVRRHWDVWHS